MSVDQAAEWGYEAPPKSQGIYLRLDSKGDSVRVRIVSPPLKFTDSFTDEKTGKTRESTKYAWVVIHKEIIEGKAVKTVRAFKAGVMIYTAIYDLVKTPEWGVPTNYDLVITRTEEKGRYYTVAPLPQPMGPISDAEKKLVEEANLDLGVLFCGEGREEKPDEPDPFADE